MAADPRFVLAADPQGADVTDAAGVARFDVTIPGPGWELAFHTQAPTANVDLYSGTGVQGQVTWSGPPQSASVHQAVAAPVVGRFVVRKNLDALDVQGDRDMSGFVFAVQSGGSTIATVTTQSDGRTPPIGAGAGDYRIVEVGRPEWATGLLDGGPIDARFDPTGGAPPDTVEAEFVYTNACRHRRSPPAHPTQPTATSSSTSARRTRCSTRSSTPSATAGSYPAPRTSPGANW